MKENEIFPHAKDEFGSLETVALWGGTSFEHMAGAIKVPITLVLDAIHEYPHRLPQKIVEQVKFSQCLRKAGVTIVHPHHPKRDLSDEDTEVVCGVDPYCRDFIGVVDDSAYRTRLPEWRMRSHMLYDRIFDRIPTENRQALDEEFSWGNGLLYDDNLIVGFPAQDALVAFLGERDVSERLRILQHFDREHSGLKAMESVLQDKRIPRNLVRIMLDCHTDIDFVLAPLPKKKHGDKRRVLVQVESVSIESLSTLRGLFDQIIPIEDPKNVLPANILWLNPETAIVAREASRTAKQVEELGYDVIKLPMTASWEGLNTEHMYAGGWRCITAPIRRADDYVG